MIMMNTKSVGQNLSQVRTYYMTITPFFASFSGVSIHFSFHLLSLALNFRTIKPSGPILLNLITPCWHIYGFKNCMFFLFRTRMFRVGQSFNTPKPRQS